MSWMGKLYDTYEEALLLDLPHQNRVMPIGHTLQNAHINIAIDSRGNFLNATVLEKIQVVLPATERSAGRSSGEAPHPLADKLQYVAKDYSQFGGLKKHYFESYREQLTNWCNSASSHPDVISVLHYVEKGTLIRDLVELGICRVDEDKRLLTTWDSDATNEEPTPLLLKILPKTKGEFDQGNALVCWSVHTSGEEGFNTWENEAIQRCWVDFDAQNAGENQFCSVSGKTVPLATNHPAKIRHTGDKAKLVSANDSSGYTYRGHFLDSNNVANVSFEVTQKAHNALRWLIGQRNQAYRNGDQIIVIWATSGKEIPNPISSDSSSIFDEVLTVHEDSEAIPIATKIRTSTNLGQQFAVALKKYMAGYYQSFANSPTESIAIMGLDSATPGRMAVTYYRDFMAKDFLDIVSQWHSDFAWPQRIVSEYQDAKGKTKSRVKWLPGAPTPWTILHACYGSVVKSNESLKKQVTERLLPSILEEKPLPADLLQLAVNRASNPNSGERWEWERNLGVTCALYRGYFLRHPIHNQRREHSMALDTEQNSRDYLYGRLLAVAEATEEMALFVAGEKPRATHASRLMQRFADRPFSTWPTINSGLQPYLQRLRVNLSGQERGYQQLIDEICNQFDSNDYTSDKKLTGEYLLGFHCQRQWLRDHKVSKGQWVQKTPNETSTTQINNEGEI